MTSERGSKQDRTIRQQMIDLLSHGEMTVRDLSQSLRIQEREVYQHLEHIPRSALTHGLKMEMAPSRCIDCGYVFRERKRLTRPSRCPACRHSHLEVPRFRLCAIKERGDSLKTNHPRKPV